MRKILLIHLLVVGSTSLIAAQSSSSAGLNPPAGVQSPNAAGLGTFGNVTVSQFTGAPNIEVPLYTVQDGSISVPIALRYNAAGFRPDEHPGWVGMGWSLQAGGVITRVVNGEPDEFAVPVQPTGPSMYPTLGYYYTNQILNSSTSTWSSQNNLSEIAGRTISSSRKTFFGRVAYAEKFLTP